MSGEWRPVPNCTCLGCMTAMTAMSSDDPKPAEDYVDRVIKGIADGSLSRSTVRQIGDAVKGRQTRDEKNDALGRALRLDFGKLY